MKRIYIHNKHFASIPDNLFEDFKSIEKTPLRKWIRYLAYREYNVELNDDGDFERFKELLQHDYFENSAEWLKEKMRLHIRQNNEKKEIRFYVERVTSRGQTLYMTYDNILSQYSNEPIYSWTSNINLCAKFKTYTLAVKCFEKNFSKNIEYNVKEFESMF